VARDFLFASDSRWGSRDLIELASQSFDPDRQAIGGSAYPGDMAALGIVVPAAPTTALNNRYMMRHCGVQVPAGKSIIIHAIRQLVTIRQVEVIDTLIEIEGAGSGQLPGSVILPLSRPAELEVTSPGWSFTDGNVSWHLKFLGDRETAFVDPTGQTLGTSPDLYGVDSALCYTGAAGPVPYTAPNGGIPPGRPVPGWDTWRDMRYPWQSDNFNTHIRINGPGVIVLWSSVRQTDPTTRPVLDVVDLGCLRPEDRFLATFRSARYGRVAGAMIVETLPIPGEPL
jgi:hypothetical protein